MYIRRDLLIFISHPNVLCSNTMTKYYKAENRIDLLTNLYINKKKMYYQKQSQATPTFELQARNIPLNQFIFRCGSEIIESTMFPSVLPIILLFCLFIRCSSKTRNHRPLETCPGGGGRHTDMHHIWQQTGC